MLNLPTELLVYIVSFLISVRDRVKLLYVSRRLRNVLSETPSLWREFVWPYYSSDDESCVNYVLKICGQHVKRLSFPHHVTPSKLVGMSKHCKNVIQLKLSTNNLNPEQLGNILLYMKHLQRLDIQWDTDHEIKRLLDEVVGMNLMELIIRVWLKHDGERYYDNEFCQSFSFFLDYWMSLGFVPQNVSLFMATRTFELWEETLLNFWYKAKSNSPDGCTGYFKWYVNHKIPMNLFPVLLPVLQLELGRTAHLPLMDCGLHVQGLDDLVMLTGCVNNGNAVYRAIVYKQKFGQELIWSQFSRDLLSNTTNLNYIIELNLPVCNLSSDQLRQIGVTFPNLQRLDLSQNEVCLRRLQSLRTIASYCHHLQGLNLFGIPAVKVEDQIQFWEILSDMKLTHLAIDLCLTLPSTEDDKQKMIKMFEKCSSLQVLEANIGFCHQINMKLTILSHFSSLVFYRTHSISIDQSAVLQDLLAGCKALKFLSVTVHSSRISVLQSFPLISYCSLQQLLVTSIATDLSDNFTSMISVHGGLEHVVLYVRSVTSEGVTVLVKNSPSLMTFHVIARIFQHTETHERIDPNVLEMRIKQEYSQHRLFVFGSYIIKVDSWLDLLDHHRNSDLFSMWSLT